MRSMVQTVQVCRKSWLPVSAQICSLREHLRSRQDVKALLWKPRGISAVTVGSGIADHIPCLPMTDKKINLQATPPLEELSNFPSPVFDKPLPMQLHSLQGSQPLFEELHKHMRQLESSGVDASVFAAAHRFLVDISSTEMREVIFSYLDGDEKLGQETLNLIGALDAQLFMRHVLLEDLSDEFLEEWRQDPSLFNESTGFKRARMPYGPQTRFPIPCKGPCDMPHRSSASRRQFIIERLTQQAALQEYLALQQHNQEEGRGASTQKRIWMKWVEVMALEITRLRSVAESDPYSCSKHMHLVCNLSLSAEVLSVMTCQTVLNHLYISTWRRRGDEDGAKMYELAYRRGDLQQHKSVPFAMAVVAVGEAVSLENIWKESQEGMPPQAKLSKGRAITAVASRLRKNRALQEEQALKTHTVPVGAALVDIFLQCTKVKCHRTSQMVEAFQHTLVREGKKLVGYIQAQPDICEQMELEKDDTMAFLAPKHQPMITPPRPWRPSAANPEGGYLLHRVPFIRTSNQKATHLKVYDTRRVAHIMDTLGGTPWRINERILKCMEEAWERNLAIADIPDRNNPVVEDLPQDTDDLSEDDQKSLKLRRYNAVRRQAELRSERPTFQLKLKVAQDFKHAAALYFPHNVDFRGRAYPIPPHLNHIGDDVCRGLLRFAEEKPLGEEGLDWLKISVANLFGKDKASFQERIDFVDENKQMIMDVADNPLSEDSIPRWTKAGDGPWQALARCFELAEAWRSPDPRLFLSCLPVHMDGSCNGLQHYAAIGRDEDGAKAVNLWPSDRPQDVYRFVLEIVKEKVKNDADTSTTDATEKALQNQGHAKMLQDLSLLQRKVVKRTIMTICYGVTSVGAKEQVRKELHEMIGDQVDPKVISHMAGYLSGLILKSIDEVFEKAMKIKRWFDKVSSIMNALEAPVQWFSPIGLACTQPYRKRQSLHIRTQRQTVTLTGTHGREGPKIHKSKQRMGFPPNFVHSLDATHMMLVAEGCAESGIVFAGVHDSFWTHACDGAVLAKIIREKFIELHRQPILKELEVDLRIHLGSREHMLPPLPEQGDLDLEVVRDSPYMFA